MSECYCYREIDVLNAEIERLTKMYVRVLTTAKDLRGALMSCDWSEHSVEAQVWFQELCENG